MEGPGCVAGLHGYTGSRHRPEERVQRLWLSLVPTCRGLTPAPRSESATSPEDPVEPPVPVPSPCLDLPGAGRWQTRGLEETGGNSLLNPIPDGRRERSEGGRPDARRQACRTVRGGTGPARTPQAHGLVHIWDCYIK